jgi:hypothetical protein
LNFIELEIKLNFLEERNEQLRSKKYEMNLMNEEIKEQRGK